VNTASTSPLTSIFDGKVCVGFTFAWGVAGVAAFNEFGSLGFFENQDAAIAAIAGNRKEMPGRVGARTRQELEEQTKHDDNNQYSKQLQV
jgi:hypothetical protein